MGGQHRRFAHTCPAQFYQCEEQYTAHQRNYMSQGKTAIEHIHELSKHDRSLDAQIRPGNDW